MTSADLLPPLRDLPRWDRTKDVIYVGTMRGFTCEVSRIRFIDGTRVQEPTKSDVERLQEVHFLYRMGPTRDSFVVKTVQTGSEADTSNEARKKFDRVITALRLLRSQPISLGDCVAYQPAVQRSARQPWLFEPVDLSPLALLGRYELPRRKVKELKGLYAGLLVELGGSAEVAFRRFSLAHRRGSPEDRLIDFWVALEALFSEGPQELNYKIAMRITHFVGDEPNGRRDLFKALRKAYNMRSVVVHGVPRKQTKDFEKYLSDVKEAETRTADALREALRRIVLGGRVPTPEELDDIAVRGRC